MTLPLLAPLQRRLKSLSADLRTQSETQPSLRDWLRGEYAAAFGTRTGGTYETWRDEQIDQASVAWLLGTVFVRFCEDNDLIGQQWIAGPGDRTEAAVQEQTAWLLAQTELRNARDWLRQAFSHLAGLPATAALFDAHNPVWRWDLSGDTAAELLDFWRTGAGVHDFTDSSLDTRFLGDLYQDLSAEARKRYALLQTPEFVEEFILDLTLEESLKEFGLEDTSLIDPTCGSGHFLLGAFDRLVRRWDREHPTIDLRVRVQNALDQVTGVDINPFAVAIARFRLLVAALQACDEKNLTDAPGFRMRLAAGDSLLKWGREDSSHQGDMLALLETGEAYAYYTEDADALAEYLRPGQYTLAVGNPPYITVKDKYLNGKYRTMYKTCSGLYALSVPFIERFFELVSPKDDAGRAGVVGQITANSFMKREFGKKLIEEYFAHKVELSRIIDTSGAFIPGHGTPTVILTGRRRAPAQSTMIRAVLGVLGEPSEPEIPSQGAVWRAIVESQENPTLVTPYLTIEDIERSKFGKHPWSLSGGGAAGVRQELQDQNSQRLHAITELTGYTGQTNADDVFLAPDRSFLRRRAARTSHRQIVVGDIVRDWAIGESDHGIFLYDDDSLLPVEHDNGAYQWLWPTRTTTWARATFSKVTYRDEGRSWWEWHQVSLDRLRTPLSIAFAFVATHNHFVLDRGGKVFNRSAPVIKLSEGASEDDHLRLLGLLNSSTACFWLKQVSHDKGIRGEGGGFTSSDWERFFEFTGTKLQEFPVPKDTPLERARSLDRAAQNFAATRPAALGATRTPNRGALDDAHGEHDRLHGEMISTQEELDWEVYRIYGLLDDDLTAPAGAVPPLRLGERAFEIVLARNAVGEPTPEWFTRHGSTPITEIPDHWPEAYREIVARRIEVIESRPDIALIERPECKRRWASVPWEVEEKAALRDWLLDRLEADSLWRGPGANQPMSVRVLADEVGADADFRSVLDLYCGRDDYDVATELTKLVADEAVPFLAAYRYRASGLDKRAQWERTWDLQRREDAGEKLAKPIPVPPKYAQADFARTPYWRNRGKLDVPKERFIAYPHAGREGDRSPVIGWAGWDHLEQAQALAALYVDRRQNEGWPAKDLLPLLAGLVELEPWLRQWHGEPAAGYPGSPAEFYTTLIDAELAAHGADRDEVGLGRLP